MNVIKAGAASVDFSIPHGIAITGRHEVHFSEGTRDPLGAHAIAVQREELMVAIVSLDLCVIEEEDVARIRVGIEKKLSIPQENIFICATHSHSAPVTYRMFPYNLPNPEFIENVIESSVKSVCQAVVNIDDAKVYFGQVDDSIAGFNRRGIRFDGTADMYCGPTNNEDFATVEGPRDTAVSLVAFCRPDKREPFALLGNYSCHLGCMFSSPFFSADFPGEIRKNLRRLWGEDLTLTYLQGFAGDTCFTDMTCPSNTMFGEIGSKRIGLSLAGSFIRAFAQGPKGYDDVILAVERIVTKVPYREISEEEYQRAKSAYTKIAGEDGSKLRKLNTQDISIVRPIYQDYDIVHIYELTKRQDSYPMEVQVIRIGGAAIVGTSTEPFVAWGHKIKEFSPAMFTIPVGLANGFGGYVPTRRSFAGGGYQVRLEFTSRLVPEAGDIMVEAIQKLLFRMFS
jgi:neutral ceramidase